MLRDGESRHMARASWTRQLIALAGGVKWPGVFYTLGSDGSPCFSPLLKASVGRQSPRVVSYPVRSLCPGEPGLQSAAGSVCVVGPFSFQHRPDLSADPQASWQRKVVKVPKPLQVSICLFLP